MNTKKMTLDDCTEIFRGIKVSEDKEAGIEYHIVKMNQFNNNSIKVNSNEKEEFGKKTQIKNKRLRVGDIVIPSRAASFTKIAIFEKEENLYSIVNHQYWIIRPSNPNELNSYFLLYFLLDKETQKNLVNNSKSTGNGMFNLDGKTIENLEINIPPIEEQIKMVEIYEASIRINKFKKSTDEISKNINNEAYSSFFLNDENIVKQIKKIEKMMNDLEDEYYNLKVLAFPETFI